MNKVAFFFFLVIVSTPVFAQTTGTVNSENPKHNVGIGMGLDYGSIGVRYTYMVAPKIGLFGSLGCALLWPGFNVGVDYKFTTSKRCTPFLSVMYGYNATIIGFGTTRYDEIYFGPSIGAGLEVKRKRKPKHFWSFEAIMAFRSDEYFEDIRIARKEGVDVFEDLPVSFSVGYHFVIK